MLSLATYLLAAIAVGIQFGWQPNPNGGNTYIVQVEPQLIDSFRREGYASNVPPQLRDIRRIEIRVGTGPLPNQGETVFKPFTDGRTPAVADARQPRLAESPDPASPPTVPPTTAPTKLAPPATAPPATALPPKTIVRASYPPREDPARRSDGGPSAAAVAPGAAGGVAGGRSQTVAKDDAAPPSPEPTQPSLAFMAALAALIVSAAGNLYLAWVHLGTRRRYREVVGQLRETDLPIAISSQ